LNLGPHISILISEILLTIDIKKFNFGHIVFGLWLEMGEGSSI
jgi:hypothetical protein